METSEILVYNDHHPTAWFLFFLSLSVIIVCSIILGLESVKKQPDPDIGAITCPFLLVFVVLLLASLAPSQLGKQIHDALGSSVSVREVTKTLETDYGVTHIIGGSKPPEEHLDPDDAANNTYTAEQMTITGKRYTGCQVTFSPVTEREKKTYLPVKLTCQDPTDQQKTVTLKPTQ
jgi:hypothetical protein